MGVQEPLGKQQMSLERQWLDFNTTPVSYTHLALICS